MHFVIAFEGNKGGIEGLKGVQGWGENKIIATPLITVVDDA